ncbi:hypothetical protein [Streptomyces sp. IBSBF 2507]|uniref:hypothetical protein n=1 Tax=Streptomyces sp. IBSBF 2507 TaxID=2903530 RepID=UPI00351EB491
MSARDNVRKWMIADNADELLDELTAEVRAEAAADVHRAELPKFPAGETPVNVAKVVRAVDVRLAERGAEAPYGVEQGADATPAPNFFQPGQTYTRAPWTFRCETISASPSTGGRRALGWQHGPVHGIRAWYATALDPDDWTHGGWTQSTEGGGES